MLKCKIAKRFSYLTETVDGFEQIEVRTLSSLNHLISFMNILSSVSSAKNTAEKHNDSKIDG